MPQESASYLRDVQYRQADRLQARASLHVKYGRADWFEWLARHLPLPAGGAVADVGCGAGFFWTNAPTTVPDTLRLRLFDLSPGMVEAARSALGTTGRWSDVRASVADATALPLEDGSVDTTLAVHMLYHLAHPTEGVREMARITRRGGAVAVVLNPPGTMAELSALIDEALGRDPTNRVEPLTSDAALPMLEREFGSVERARFEDELVVTDPVDLLAYLLSLPVADATGAPQALASTVASRFAQSPAGVRLTKCSDLLVARLT